MWENVIGITNEQAGTNTGVEALINAPTVRGGGGVERWRQLGALGGWARWWWWCMLLLLCVCTCEMRHAGRHAPLGKLPSHRRVPPPLPAPPRLAAAGARPPRRASRRPPAP